MDQGKCLLMVALPFGALCQVPSSADASPNHTLKTVVPKVPNVLKRMGVSAAKASYFGASSPNGYHCCQHNDRASQIASREMPKLGIFDGEMVDFAVGLLGMHDGCWKFFPGLVSMTPGTLLSLVSKQGRYVRNQFNWNRTKLRMARVVLPGLDVPLSQPVRRPQSKWLAHLSERDRQFFDEYHAEPPIRHMEKQLVFVPKYRRADAINLAHYGHLYDIWSPNSQLPVDSLHFLSELDSEMERTYGKPMDVVRTNYDFLTKPEDRVGPLRNLAAKFGIDFAPKYKNLNELLTLASKKNVDFYQAIVHMYKLLNRKKSPEEALEEANRKLEDQGYSLPRRAYVIVQPKPRREKANE